MCCVDILPVGGLIVINQAPIQDAEATDQAVCRHPGKRNSLSVPNRTDSTRGRNPGHTLQNNWDFLANKAVRRNPGQGDCPLGYRYRTNSAVSLYTARNPLELDRTNCAISLHPGQSGGRGLTNRPNIASRCNASQRSGVRESNVTNKPLRSNSGQSNRPLAYGNSTYCPVGYNTVFLLGSRTYYRPNRTQCANTCQARFAAWNLKLAG